MNLDCAVAVLVRDVRMNLGGHCCGRPSDQGYKVEEDGFHEEFEEAPVFAYEDRAGLRGGVSHAGKVEGVWGFAVCWG